MKSSLLLAAALAFPCLASAQTEGTGTYVRFGAGVSMVEDIDGYVGDPFGQLNFDLALDPGVRVDIAPGLNFNQYFGFELNTGIIWNSLDAFEFEDGFSASVDGDLLQVPLLANLILRYPTPANITPFIGAGGGGVYERLSFDAPGPDESSDDFFAAYQLFGGVMFQLEENINIGVVYKYLSVFSEDESSNGFETSGIGDITTHSLSAFVHLTF
jgi:opacity protein-like surface antigen